MANPLTRVGVQNMAIDALRQKNIAAADDNTAVGKWMGRNYDIIRDGLLRSYPWNFAMARAQIAADATPPAFGWDYAYPFPADCLKVMPLTYDGVRNGRPIPHEVEGNRILTNAVAPLKVRYIARKEEEGSWDILFAEVMALTMAFRMSLWLTGKQSVKDEMRQDLQQLLAQARLSDALEGSPEAIYDTDIIDVRYE